MPVASPARLEPRDTLPIVAVAWFLGVSAASLVLAVAHGSAAGDPTIAALGASLVALWAVHVGASILASHRFGSGDVLADFGMRAAPIDLVGVPLGVAAQLVLVPVVYAPLRSVWPDTFSEDRLEETARDLVDRASGGSTLLLFVLVAVGAPLVEELFYRGLLQRPLLGRWPTPIAIVFVAAVFAAIHFRPVEFVGLFVVGLVFGVCAWATDRLGLAVVSHVAFNVTGLLLVS
jgi:membrane protease YdiL (CAAX protease family)